MNENNPTVDSEGNKKWFLHGKLHREDGPAIEWANGDKWWYLDGERHREDGPAIEDANGDKWWFINGKCHREDGPAIEYANGTKEWYLYGTKLTEELFNKLTKGPVKNLPMYLGMGFDDYISERLKR